MVKKYYEISEQLNFYLIIKNNNKKKDVYNSLQKEICYLLNNIYNKIHEKFLLKHYYREIYNKNSEAHIKNIYNVHLKDNRYVDDNIKNYIKDNIGTILVYKIVDPIEIIITFIIYSKKILLYEYDELVKNILTQIEVINIMTRNNSCNKNGIYINIFMTPFKKKIYKDDIILGAKNVNSGFCYGCNSKAEIIIFRKEELFKVLTHELLHTYDVGIFIDKYNNINNVLIDKFNIHNNSKKNVKLLESIVEFWALFLNNAFFSYINLRNLKMNNNKNINNKIYRDDVINYKKMFEINMKLEILHGLMQITKILNFNNMDYRDLILDKNKVKIGKIYRENSHILSYYIIKFFLLYDYKNFININVEVDNGILFKNTDDVNNINAFINYIISMMTNKCLLDDLNKIKFYYKSQKKTNNCFFNNLKMSVIELK
tara:strand:- start:2409 stop:3695 length:1287 start_codon:yes stop_codon:yes gene_type:complete